MTCKVAGDRFTGFGVELGPLDCTRVGAAGGPSFRTILWLPTSMRRHRPVRISGSRVSAVCGLHPFVDVCDLFEEHLYQDATIEAVDSTWGLSRLTREDEVAQASAR